VTLIIYCKSWGRNSNGQLRVVILPRGNDIQNTSPVRFSEIIDNYNSTPRKSLDQITEEQVFKSKLKSAIV